MISTFDVDMMSTKRIYGLADSDRFRDGLTE